MKEFLENLIEHVTQFDPIDVILILPDENKLLVSAMVIDKTINFSATSKMIDGLDAPLCISNIRYLAKLLSTFSDGKVSVEKGTSIEGMEIIKYINFSNNTMKAKFVATDPKIFKGTGVAKLNWREPFELSIEHSKDYNIAYNVYKLIDSDANQASFNFSENGISIQFGEQSNNVSVIFSADCEEMPSMLFRSDRLNSIMSAVSKDGSGKMFFNEKALMVMTEKNDIEYQYVIPKMTRSRA